MAATLAACSAPKATTSGPAPEKAPEHTLSAAERQRYDELFLEAIRYKQKNEFDAAAQLLDEALRIRPDAPEALMERGVLHAGFLVYGDSAQAALADSMLQKAVATDSLNPDYLTTLGELYFQNKDYAKATELFQRVVHLQSNVGNLTALLRSQQAAGQYAEAVATLGQLEKIIGRSEETTMMKFDLYNRLDDREHAYAAIEALCAEYPEEMRYRVLLGDLYMQQGYMNMAETVYKDVLAFEPDNAYAQVSLLAYYKKNGQDSLYIAMLDDVVANPATSHEARREAIQNYMAMSADSTRTDSAYTARLLRLALRHPQDDAKIAIMQAAFLMNCKADKALQLRAWEYALAIEPTEGNVRRVVLQMQIERNETEKAAETAHGGTLNEPENPMFYYYEAAMLSMAENNDAALQALDRAVSRIDARDNPEEMSDIYALRGDIHHEAGQLKAAFDDYEEAIRLNDANLMCLNNYAYFLCLTGDSLDRAEALSRRTLDANPSEPTFLDTYAWILFLKKDFRNARTYIDSTLALTAEEEMSAEVLDHAGDIYFHNGRRNEALKFWVRALAKADKPELRATLKRKIKRRRP